MVLQVKLINMPFADIMRPSIALAQLRGVLIEKFGESVSVDVLHLNHDVAAFVGRDIYDFISNDVSSTHSGLGEWIFRRAAFPDAEENSEDFLVRFGPLFHKAGTYAQLDEAVQRSFGIEALLDHLLNLYDIEKADIVGFTSMFSQTLASIALAQRLRLRAGRRTIVIGGANCEGVMGRQLAASFPVLDFVFSGGALISFPSFIKSILDGNVSACHEINGVFSGRNLALEQNRPNASNLALLKPPSPTELEIQGVCDIGDELDINISVRVDYNDFFTSLDAWPNIQSRTEEVTIPFETSRGCWWGERAHCTFCGLNGASMAYRAMTPDVALLTIRGLLAEYNGKNARPQTVFGSVDNIVPREYFSTVFKDLKCPEGASLFYEVKADLTEEQIVSLARSGVTTVQPGIEALSTKTLKLMKKGTTALGNLRFLRFCRRHSVRPLWNLLVGFPGEEVATYQAYAQMIPHILHLPPPAGIFPIRFDRFSPYFVRPGDYQLELRPFAFYELCYDLPIDQIENMAYYFEDHNVDSKHFFNASIALETLQPVVQTWNSRWASAPRDVPTLTYVSRPEGDVIRDCRQSDALEYEISIEALDALKAADKPIDLSRLTASHGASVDLLLERRLLAREGERVVGLVTNL